MPGKTLKLKPKFKARRPSMPGFASKTKSGKSKKVRSKAAAEGSDEDSFSDDYDEVSSGDEVDDTVDDTFFHKKSNARFGMLERTWSVNAFNVSGHSAVYLDDSEDGSETDDDSSSYESFGGDDDDDDELYVTDEEDDNTTAKITNETKGENGTISPKKKKRGSKAKKSESPISTRRSSTKFKNKMKQLTTAHEIIPECDEDDEVEELSNSNDCDNDNDNDNNNDNDNESDDDSVSYFQKPFSLRRPPSISELMAAEKVDSGYSSDSALVRKRMLMLQKEQEEARRKKKAESSKGKKKKGGKKKAPSKKKEKKKGNKNGNNSEKENPARMGGGSLEGDSTVTTISVESEEDVRQSPETKNGKKKKTKGDKNGKKKKKKNGKDEKKKKKRVISFVVDGDDEACADFDKRLEEIEQFEASLVEERKLMQKERETMAFERESMEMRLDEETQHCDDLNRRIKELEQEVQSQQISNAGNVVESIDEKHGLKLDFAREKREFHLQLVEKEREIEDLKLTVRDLQILQGAAKNVQDNSFDSNNLEDVKSRERLQGELLQTTAKLSEREAQLKSQAEELESAREEVAALKLGRETLELKRLLLASQEENKKLQQEFENERKETAAKLKDKDETVAFFMNELARMKKDQSIATKRR